MSADVIQVIRTSLLRRGKGDSPASPVRIITQFWTLDGQLLAEVDPFPDVPASPLPSTEGTK